MFWSLFGEFLVEEKSPAIPLVVGPDAGDVCENDSNDYLALLPSSTTKVGEEDVCNAELVPPRLIPADSDKCTASLQTETATTTTSTNSRRSSFSSCSTSSTCNSIYRTCSFHPAPPNVDYADNPTVFGQIMRGEIPAAVVRENDNLLAFHDIRPRAPLHVLIIPKRFITSVFALTKHDIPLLLEMKQMAIQVLRDWYQNELSVNAMTTSSKDDYSSTGTTETDEDNAAASASFSDYRLVFHIPPYNSVQHLHLHVLAPVSEMGAFPRYVRYLTNCRWSIGLDRVLARLDANQTPVPYRGPNYLY